MFLVGLISWWYGRGWVAQWSRILGQFKATLDFFSVGQLLSTLFNPFRQISASDGSDGSLGDAFRAFFDKTISRLIGAIIRIFTIVIGLFVMLLQVVYSVVVIVAWWFIPLLPIIGCILFASGWTVQWT